MPKSLLIVDDEPQICSALTRLLRPDGYTINHANSPAEGIELMQQRPYDVVLTDYMMPGTNGVQFLSEVSRRFPDTVRLMLSGQADMNAVIDAINTGSIFKFITKPWNNDSIRQVISEAFSLKEASNKKTDEESGWLTRTRFLEQSVASAAGGLMVVGEWVDASTCLSHLDPVERRRIYDTLTNRIEQTLDLTGELGHIEKATFGCVAADEMTPTQWHHLNNVLSEPIATEQGSVRGTFRFGLSRLEQSDLGGALKQALIAVNGARSGTELFYTEELGTQIHRRRTLEGDLHHAIERNELYFELQPQLSVATGKVVSAEALLRWNHPRLGMISPLHIVDMAEQNGLINDIGYWIANECCSLLAQWSLTQENPIRLSVNVSPRQFLTGDVISDVSAIISHHKIDPRLLEVEITESCVMSDPKECANRLKKLSDLGVRIALDDFGTGHSSLATLSQLNVDVLKIDRAFVSELTEDSGAAFTLLQHIVGLAKSLNLEVVAEGVETTGQADICSDLGCNLIQGYLISKPISVAAFERLAIRAE